MPRRSPEGLLFNFAHFGKGLTPEMIRSAIDYVHDTLDTLDEQLLNKNLPRMTGLVELANLSSIIGNIFSSGVVANSNAAFVRAGPHKYQDLRTTGRDPSAVNIEVKVALEANKPKGHLAKSGDYITCRYVLADAHRNFTRNAWKASIVNETTPDETRDVVVQASGAKKAKQRIVAAYPGWIIDSEPIRPGEIVWLWEVRFGYLTEAHFNVSNTERDSGKTAVINANGMDQLKVLYFDPSVCPHGANSRSRKRILAASEPASPLPQQRSGEGSA